MVAGKMKPHRHRAQVVGVRYDQRRGISWVKRRCRCGEKDVLEVLGKWCVRKREGEVSGMRARNARGGRVSRVREGSVRAVCGAGEVCV